MKEFVFRRVLRFGCLIGALVVYASVRVSAIPAAPMTLVWDASADKSIAGYAVYYRLANSPSSSSTRLDAGKSLEATISNLQASTNYLFYVVGYKSDGSETSPSNPLVYNPPAVSQVLLFPFEDGSLDILFRAAAGSHCRVEYSSTLDVSSWQILGNAIADADGYVEVNDSLQGQPMMRFYRGVLVKP